LQTVGTEKPDGSRAVTNSEDDAYVGMFLDEGDVTTDDESDGGDEDDAKNANPAQEKQPINLEMDWHDGSDISKEYLGMFLDEGDAGDEKDGDGDDDGESDDGVYDCDAAEERTRSVSGAVYAETCLPSSIASVAHRRSPLSSAAICAAVFSCAPEPSPPRHSRARPR
jgi:hypothetical protein